MPNDLAEEGAKTTVLKNPPVLLFPLLKERAIHPRFQAAKAETKSSVGKDQKDKKVSA